MRRTLPLLISAAAAVIIGAAACGGDPTPPGGAATSDGAGTLETGRPTTPAATPSATPRPGASAPGAGDEDCITYDAQVLVRHYEAGVHVVLPDHGPEILRVYGGPDDVVGRKALEVAKLFNTVCYIGRFNSFDSAEFVYEYWRDPSGAPASPLLFAEGDCVHYTPADLRVEPLGAGAGFTVTAGGADLQHFATEADANLGRARIAIQDVLCHVENTAPTGEPSDITYTFNSGD